MLAESLVRHVFRLQNHPVAWANLLLVILYRFLKAIKFNLRNVVLLNVLCCFCESSWCIVAGRIKDPAHRSKVSLSDKSIQFTATCSKAVIFVKKKSSPTDARIIWTFLLAFPRFYGLSVWSRMILNFTFPRKKYFLLKFSKTVKFYKQVLVIYIMSLLF